MKKIIKLSILSASCLFLFACGNNSTTKSTDGETPTFSFTSISPTSGPTGGGTTVTISGTLFTAATTVQFGASACTSITLVSATELTCVTPAAAEGSVSLTLTDGSDSVTEANAFTYGTPAPTFSSVAPTSYINSQTTTVTITGAGFVSGMTVTIGGAACTSVAVNSGSNITCTSPTGVGAGSHDVVVTNPSAVAATGASAFSFRVAPTLTILRGSTSEGAFQTCQGCHGSNGGLNLANYAAISARVVAGDPDNSLIWQRMEAIGGSVMPQGGPMRPASERQALADWILDGALDN